MKIKKLVLMAIRGNTELRKKIKVALGNVSDVTLWQKFTDNDDDLTKAAVLKVIREDLELTDSEILEEETEPAVNK